MKLPWYICWLIWPSWVQGQATLALVQERFLHEFGQTSGRPQCYKGLLAEDVEVYFCLAEDKAGQLKGVYAYGADGNFFSLEGEIKAGQQLWTEWDTLGQRCGMIILAREGNQWQGWWHNNDQDIQLPLLLREVQDTLQPLESSITNYRVKMNEGNALLTLVRDRLNTRGIWYNPHKNKGTSWFIRGYCLDQNCTKLELEAQNAAGEQEAELIIQADQDNCISIALKNAAHQTTYYSGQIQESMILDRLAQAAYRGYVNLNLPPSTALPAAITEMIRQKVADLKALPDQYHASQRMRQSINAWIEPGYFDQKIFSGLLIIHADDKKFNVPFLLDTQTGLAINPLTLAGNIADPKIQDYIEQVLNERDVPSPLAGELTAADFKHPVLLREGMCLCTDFNTVNGVQRVIVPYAYFGRDVLRNELVKYLLR